MIFVLGGGRGNRLFPLTKYRSKPAVPLAGKYRLIDVPLSNCINSGLNRIYVLTQFMSVSLHRHIRQTYRFDSFSGGFVEILAAQQTMEERTEWYQGTADAVRKHVRYLDQPWVEYVLILSGDQLYRMDYRDMLRTHVESGADVTIAGMPVTRQAARGLGVMRADPTGRVVGFLEKPQSDEEIDMVRTDPAWIDQRGIPSQGRDCVASMGIYLFNRQKLIDVLTKTNYQDFGREVFPASIRAQHVHLHLFDGYWEDIGTIRAFYEANLALADPEPPFDLSLPEAPIYSRGRFLPPSRLDGATVRRSILADGCRIASGTTIENSIIGLRCIIGRDVTIRDSILMGADEFETASELKKDQEDGRPRVGVGDGSVILGAIVDKNCRIGHNVRIENPSGRASADVGDSCAIRDGIPVLVKNSTFPDHWQLGT
jgi:glucose-1-phosphate adenylyltransferase